MSGAANCPETPRQKMIGMMYLVLTAMLALNVSADILNGFTLVNNSIRQSIDTSSKRKVLMMSELEVMKELNPTKVGPWLEQAREVNQKADSVYNYLQEFKVAIVKLADGETANVDTIQAKDNLDVAAQYAILGGNGEILEKKIVDFREFLCSKVEDDSTMILEFQQMFATNDALTNDGEKVPWCNSLFEHMPLVASVTMLTKLQSDVRQAELEVISHLKQQTDAGDFRVNKLGAFVATASDYMMSGDTYTATIFLSAVDSTKRPLYYVNGQCLQSDVYSVSCGAPGVYTYKGEIALPTNDGDTTRFPFERTYTVGEPSATIANEDMNVVYRGYQNKLNIAVPGVSSENIVVEAKGATLTKPTGRSKSWICNPTSASDVEIVVYANTENGKKKMGSHIFRTLRLPNPSAFLQYEDKAGETFLWPSEDKEPSRADVLRSKRVVAQYADGMLQANFTVLGFTIYAQDATGGVTPVPATSDKITGPQMSVIKGKKRGGRLVIEDIRAKGPDGVVRELSPISVAIK